MDMVSNRSAISVTHSGSEIITDLYKLSFVNEEEKLGFELASYHVAGLSSLATTLQELPLKIMRDRISNVITLSPQEYKFML